jgi:hypothetical protein
MRVACGILAGLALSLATAGCASPGGADTCGMAQFAHLVGAPADQIDRATLPAGARVITPDTMVTQDFRAERLNIMVGVDGVVGSLACY